MPRFLEDKLKAEYGADSAVPYKVMNKLGAMRGNKETAKGRAMEHKHVADAAGDAQHHITRAFHHAMGLAHHLNKLRNTGSTKKSNTNA